MRAKAIPIIDLIAKRKNSVAERIPACFGRSLIGYFQFYWNKIFEGRIEMTNITLEQIALEVSEELQAGYPPKLKGEEQITEFLRRCLAKLGEVKVEPVGEWK